MKKFLQKSMVVIIILAIVSFISLAMYFNATREYKYIPVTFYYQDGSKEVVKVRHKVYFDGSYTKLRLSDGCGVTYGGAVAIRCGVKYFRYE